MDWLDRRNRDKLRTQIGSLERLRTLLELHKLVDTSCFPDEKELLFVPESKLDIKDQNQLISSKMQQLICNKHSSPG